MLRHDRVLDRPEQRRMAAEQEQRAHQHRQAVQEETGSGDAHDDHFQHLDQAGEHRLVVLVGQLPGGGRKQEEGQDEDAGRQIGEQPGASVVHCAAWKVSRTTSAFLNRLSLKAPRNWVAKKGAKRFCLRSPN
jgi:hypothetical protein